MKWMPLALLCCSFTACVTTREVSVAQWSVGAFDVCATDTNVGERVVAALPDAMRAVELLPGLRRANDSRIDVVPFGPTELIGFTRYFPTSSKREAEIAIASDADDLHLNDERLRATLAHELTHFYLGDEWSTLPAVLEEGVCDWVAKRASPATSPADRMCNGVHLATLIAGESAIDIVPGEHRVAFTLHHDFDLERGHLAEVPEMLALRRGTLLSSRWIDSRTAMYALGDLLVQRIGVTRLHEMCLSARARGLTLIPAGELLEAAALPIDRPDLWWAHVVALTRAEERAAFGLWLSTARDGTHSRFDLIWSEVR